MNKRGTQAGRRPSNTLSLTIIAQDPAVQIGGRILTTQVRVPAEHLTPGPCGYRVHVIDYDTTTNAMFEPADIKEASDGTAIDPFAWANDRKRSAALHNKTLLEDPRFHAQNCYAIVMRILARFEFALGRRVAWGSDGHQIHVAPHAFATANAFYSRADRGLFFGYFIGTSKQTVFAALSHDVVAHETTHALLDGLRGRYMEPSSPDQAAFHEGFADVVALLSVLSLSDIVSMLIDTGQGNRGHLIRASALTREALSQSVLLGLALQMGEEMSGFRGQALRRSVMLPKGRPYRSLSEYEECHNRGELLVAAMLNTFLDVWLARLDQIGFVAKGAKDRRLVIEQGAKVADHLLTMAIRAIDYCPPTDIDFSDFLSALLTIDHEVVPDDSRFGYRDALLKNFASYDIPPAEHANSDGTWIRCEQSLSYSRSHFDSMLRDKEEVFRFLWENRQALELNPDGYIEVQSVRPSWRVGPDGFILHETVAEYVQIMTLEVGELKVALKIEPPPDMPTWRRVQIFGGGALVFDEYGQLKFHIRNRIENAQRQTSRLAYLWDKDYFDDPDANASFALMHLTRAQYREPEKKKRRK
jgi:hypothetical protein